jgi:hypothetical protein
MTDTFTIGTAGFAGDLKLPRQARKVLAHLLQGKDLTPLTAIGVYHIYRLAARIHDLREAGYDISTEMREDGVGGRYASYRLVNKKKAN